MPKDFLVVTVVGPDRRGLVAEITEDVVTNHANIEESRMARLGGEFAIIMLISLTDGQRASLLDELKTLEAQGLTVITKPTDLSRLKIFEGFVPYEISVIGADHEGIVHKIAEYLAEERIQVETMDTRVTRAPMSGTPLFSMLANVQAPPEVTLKGLREKLSELGDSLCVDVEVKLPLD
jgi:glycine cleavage system transcriptional repressor